MKHNTYIKPGTNNLQIVYHVNIHILEKKINCIICDCGNNVWYYDINIDSSSSIILTNNI